MVVSHMDLVDRRLQVDALYAAVRPERDIAHERWRRGRDDPLEARLDVWSLHQHSGAGFDLLDTPGARPCIARVGAGARL